MRKAPTKNLAARMLPILAAAAVAGMMGVNEVSAQPAQFSNGQGDGLWSTPGNWTTLAPPSAEHAWINVPGSGPATINTSVPTVSPGEIIIGQGAGDGHVIVTAGGSITSGPVNMGWNNGRNGTWEQNGGSATVGELRVGRGSTGNSATVNLSGGTLTTGVVQLSSRTDEGGFASATSTVNVSGGTLTAGGLHTNGQQGNSNIEIAHLGGTATMNITGGVVYGASVLVSNLGTSTATGHLNVTGGELRVLQIGVGPSGATATGIGHVSIGGNALVQTVNHIFLRPDGKGTFTVNGSGATININRVINPANIPVTNTGFEVSNGSVVNFNADAGGFSTVNIVEATMRINPGSNSVLNVDATPLGNGIYTLFTFGGGYRPDSQEFFGIENLLFASGRSGSVLYNANSIQLQVVPEPAALGLLGIVGLGLMARRRRK